MTSGPEAEDLTSKFLYAVVEILLDFISQTNDRQSGVLYRFETVSDLNQSEPSI